MQLTSIILFLLGVARVFAIGLIILLLGVLSWTILNYVGYEVHDDRN